MAAAAPGLETNADAPGYDRSELLAIIKARSFRTGNFTLASGRQSTLYFNLKPTMMSARGAELSARGLLQIAGRLAPRYVGGLEMGAVPVIGSLAALSSAEGRPIDTIFVRKRAKDHGTQDLIEGLGPDESLAGQEVLVIDDVITSGGSTLRAIEAIRGAGGIVRHAACLVDREEGGAALLAEQGVTLHPVLRARDFLS